MRMRVFSVLLFAALMGCASDVSNQSDVSVGDFIDRCEQRASCILSREAEVVEVGHSILARHMFLDGSCINLVLNDERITRRGLGRSVSFSATGHVQNIELRPTEFLVRYNGIRVDVDGSCDGLFFISVDQ